MTSTSSTRYEGDTWDLASSVGVTATMVAAARAIATRADRPIINDPFAEPLVRAVGVDLLTRLASGELDPAELNDVHDGAAGSAGAMSRMADNMAVRTKFFDEFFIDATNAGHQAGGDPGLRAGCPRLPAGVARRDGGLRGRPAAGHRIQVPHPGRAGRRAHRRPARGGHRSARRLAGRAARRRASTRRSRPRGAPRACWATCRRKRRTVCWTPSPRSARRAAGWPPKARPTPSPVTRTRSGSACRPSPSAGAHTASTSTWRGWSTSATATRRRRTWRDRGWRLRQQSASQELFAANGLAPLEDDDMRMGEMLYISGTLDEQGEIGAIR